MVLKIEWQTICRNASHDVDAGIKMNFKNLLSSLNNGDFSVESEIDRRKVHELASRSLGVRE